MARVFRKASDTLPPVIAAFKLLCIELVSMPTPFRDNVSPVNPFTASVVITAVDIMFAIRCGSISPVASCDAIASCIKSLVILPTATGADPFTTFPFASYSLVSLVNPPVSSSLSNAPSVSLLTSPSTLPTPTSIPPIKNASSGS